MLTEKEEPLHRTPCPSYGSDALIPCVGCGYLQRTPPDWLREGRFVILDRQSYRVSGQRKTIAPRVVPVESDETVHVTTVENCPCHRWEMVYLEPVGCVGYRLANAVQMDPEDAAQRLVLADWCEEQGHELFAMWFSSQLPVAVACARANAAFLKNYLTRCMTVNAFLEAGGGPCVGEGGEHG